MTELRALPPVDARVLVVDDDGDLLDALCEVLRDSGYQVSSASNGFEALRVLDQQPLPDLILLDLMMPVMDGFTFRQLQLADPQLAAIPTIALSAGVIDASISRMRVAAWMCKPVSVDGLLAAIELHRLRRAAGAVATAAHPGHSMQFYDDDAQLAIDVARFLAPAVVAVDPVVVIATPDHWQRFEAELGALGCEPILARGSGRIQVFDARQTLDSFLVDGAVVESRFREVVEPVVAAASCGTARLRAYGEMVDLLWRDGEVASAVALEQCWNRLLSSARCELHCAYALPASDLHHASVDQVRLQHAA